MSTILAKQLAAFRLEHGIPEGSTQRRAPPPSVLFSPSEAKTHDPDAFATLALQGIAGVATLEPDVVVYKRLFQGPMKDRKLLARNDSDKLDSDIHRFLVLLSPHMQVHAAQECLEGLLYRYHVHRWNLDDVLACMLPYHDSTLFTRLLQGLLIEGKPRWQWLKPLKDQPATLVRATLAKYCAKDYAMLMFIGETAQETLKLQKANRALATFFAAVWIDTLAQVSSITAELANAALPTILLALRRPHMRDMFHAALTVVGALCTKVDLDSSVQVQLVDRAAKQASGVPGRSAGALMVLLLQLQALNAVPAKALRCLAAAGPHELISALPFNLDCGNLLTCLVEACIIYAIDNPESEDGQQCQALANGLLEDTALVDNYAPMLSLALLDAFNQLCSRKGIGESESKQAIKALLQPLTSLAERQPAALGGAFKKAVATALERGSSTEPLTQLLGTSGVALPVAHDGTSIVAIEAFSHESAEVRCKAVQSAVAQLEGSRGRKKGLKKNRLLAGMVLQSLEDDDMTVVKQTLETDALWTKLAEVEVKMTAPVLQKLLTRLVGTDLLPKAVTLPTMLNLTILGEEQVATLVPLVLQCLAAVHSRADCTAAQQEQMDKTVIPLLCFILAGLEDADKKEHASQQDLKSAALKYCQASQHPLAAFLRDANNSADARVATDLCCLVQGKHWQSGGKGGYAAVPIDNAGGLLGGAASQLAAAYLLTKVLPKCTKAGMPENTVVMAHSVEACRSLTWQLAHAGRRGMAILEAGGFVCMMVQTTLKCIADAHYQNSKSTKSVRMKKKGGSSSSTTGAVDDSSSTPQAAVALLHLMLERPKVFCTELKKGFASQANVLRPALLKLAFDSTTDSTGQKSVCRAHALLMLRSLLVSPSCADWVPDQSLLVPLITCMTSSQDPSVRSASMGVLQVLRDTDIEAMAQTSWDTPNALLLRCAGVTRSVVDVFGTEGWDTLQKETIVLSRIEDRKACQALCDCLCKQKDEIQQDTTVPASIIRRFLSPESGKLPQAQAQLGAFLLVGLAQLHDTIAPAIELLVAALPAKLLDVLKKPLTSITKEVLQSLKDDHPADANPPALLVVAIMELNSLLSKGLQDGTKAIAMSFISDCLLPLCQGLASLYESGGQIKHGPIEKFACMVLWGVAKVASETSFPQQLLEHTVTELFGLCASASACALSSAPREEEQEEKEAPETGTVVGSMGNDVLRVAHAAFVDVPLDAKGLQMLLKGPVLSTPQQTPRYRAAVDLLCKHVVTLQGEQPASADLLMALASLAVQLAKSNASGYHKKTTPPPDSHILTSVMLGIAAISENVSNGSVQKAGIDSKTMAAMCKQMQQVCQVMRGNLGTGVLGAILRTCGAFSLILTPVSKSAIDTATLLMPGEPSDPMLTTVEALSNYSHPLTADILEVMKAAFLKLSTPLEMTEKSDTWQSAISRDASVQTQLRLLLYTIMIKQKVLIETVDKSVCLSLSRSVGLQASLDFVLLLLLVRRLVATPATKTKKRRAGKLGDGKFDDEAEEILLGSLPAEEEEAPLDEAMDMFLSVQPACRYHSFGTFAIILCALAARLREGGPKAAWGDVLLPLQLLQGITTEQTYCVLRAGFEIIGRFISEHGLPQSMDEAVVDIAMPRVSATSGDQPDIAVAASSVCYVVQSLCAAEVLLHSEGEDSSARSECLKTTKHVRELLLRSLAVNHPITFFRAVCLTLQVPAQSPPPGLSGLCEDHEFSLQAFAKGLHCASFALWERREFREQELADDEDDSQFVQSSCAPLCAALMGHLRQQLLRENCMADTQVAGWRFLDGICYFSAKQAPMPVLEICLSTAGIQLKKTQDAATQGDLNAAVACCMCIHTATEQLGRGILDQLNNIVPPLLELAGGSPSAMLAAKQPALENGRALLERTSLQTLQTLVKGVGSFLSPFLANLLTLAASPSPTWRTPMLEDLMQALVSFVPHRLLLPAVQAVVATCARQVTTQDIDTKCTMEVLERSLVQLQRLALLHARIFAASLPDFVAQHVDSITARLLELLGTGLHASRVFLQAGGQPEDLPARILRRNLSASGGATTDVEKLSLVEHCVEGSVLQLNSLGAAAFAQCALRLDIETLRPQFALVLDWARSQQTHTLAKQSIQKASAPVDIIGDSRDAGKLLALTEVMRALACEAPGIMEELFLPMVLKDIATSITASKRQALGLVGQLRPGMRKRRRSAGGPVSGASRASAEILHGHTWWWFEVAVSALGFVERSLRRDAITAKVKLAEETVDAFIEPCAAEIELFEFLPPVEECHLAGVLLQGIQGALVTLAAASDGGRVKTLLTTVLERSKADDAEVRLSAVKCCHKIWTDLGVQVVSGLSEVVMFAVELMEDEDPRVETAVRAMIKTMEECTGESLQDSLKR